MNDQQANMNEQEKWDSRFREPGYAYGEEPSLFLSAQKGLVNPGMSALAVADGQGRNAVWLARQGLDVLAVDFSSEALKTLHQLAKNHGVRVRTECADLREWDWPTDAFDVIVCVYIHFEHQDRDLMHRRIAEALKPGGYLVWESFDQEQLNYASGGPRRIDWLHSEEMLRRDFASLEILQLTKSEENLHEGRLHQGPGMLLRMLARRINHGTHG